MRLALPLAFAGILSVVVECQQGNDASNFFDVLSSHPTLNSTYSALRWHSRGEFLQQLSALQNVTFLAPTNDAWDRFNFRDGFEDSPLNDGSGVSGSPTLREHTWLYHFLIGSFEEVQSDSVLATNLGPPDWTQVAGGAVVKYLHDDDSFLSGMGHLSRTSRSDGSPDDPRGPIAFDGGEIYVLDDFLHIPQNLSKTIAAINNTSSVTLFKGFGLVAHSEAPIYTVLVPSNEAWLAQKTSIDTLSPSQQDDLIRAHIIPGVRYSTELHPETTWTTLFGNTVTLSGGNFTTLNQTFTLDSNSDIPLWIGVVHIINKVLDPFNLTQQEDAVDAEPGSGHGPDSDSGSDTSPSSGTESGSGLLTGAKIGIGVAVPLVVIAIAFIAFLIFRRHKRRNVRPDTAVVPEMDSYQRHEPTGGPQHPTFAVPILQRPELDGTTTRLLPARSELANDISQRGPPHELATTTRHELPSRNDTTTSDPTKRTATST